MAKKISNVHVPFPPLPKCYEGVRVMQRNQDLFRLIGIDPYEVWADDITGCFHHFVSSLDRVRNLEPISEYVQSSDVTVVSQPGGGRIETRTLIIESHTVRVVDIYSMMFDERGARVGTSWTISLFRHAGCSIARRVSYWNRDCDEPHTISSEWRFVDAFCAFLG